MTTWSGWQVQLLGAAKLPADETHGIFLFDWSQHAASNCNNNPIDLSHVFATRRNCHKLTASRTAQNYTDHAHAATAFSAQIHSGSFPHILNALKSAIPYQQPNPGGVATELRAWGSPAFATYYLNHANVGTGGGGGGGGGGGAQYAPNVYRSWSHLQHSINRNLPTKVHRIDYAMRRTLQRLAHHRRVR